MWQMAVHSLRTTRKCDNMAEHQCCGRTARCNLEIAADPWHLTELGQTSLLHSSAVDFLYFIKSIRGHQASFPFLFCVQNQLRWRRVEVSSGVDVENVLKSPFEKKGKKGSKVLKAFVVNCVWRPSSPGVFPLLGWIWESRTACRTEYRWTGRGCASEEGYCRDTSLSLWSWWMFSWCCFPFQSPRRRRGRLS